MYDSTLGRFTTRDPIAYKGGDANLYRYTRDNPLNATDPTGLATVPLPVAGPGTILPVIKNVALAWYRRPYGLAPFPIPRKPNILKNVGELKPANCAMALTGVGRGDHQVAGLPFPANTYFGVGAADPCIGVVVACPGQVVAFHFGQASDDAGATIGQYTWPKDCHAVICGGDNSAPSNDQLVEVINSLQQNGIKLDGMVNMDGCYFGFDGKWYVGKFTMPSADRGSKK